MSTPLYELPSVADEKEVAENRKQEALDRWGKVLNAGKLEAVSSMTIGFHAYYLKKHGLFGMLGFEDEHAARKASGVGKSTWYSVIALAEAFEGLTEEQFVSMKLLNARAAMDLPASKRMSREWVRDAGIDTEEDFQEKVDIALDGREKASNGKEQGVALKVSMPRSRKKVIEQGLMEYAEKVGIPKEDQGRALEMMVVEKSGGTTLIQSITNAVQRIQEAKQLRNSYLSAEECLDRVMAILDAMTLDFADALKGAQGEEER